MKKLDHPVREVIRGTTDYEVFVTDVGTRPLKEKHVKNLMESMQRFDWVPSYPLICKEQGDKLVLIDGLHRFTAAQRLGMEVKYVVLTSNISAPEANSLPKGPQRAARN